MDDYEAVRALYEEPGMLAYMPSFFPAEEPEAYFESYVKNMYRFYDFGMYVLEDARTGRIIGHVGLGVEDSEDPDGRETERIEEARLWTRVDQRNSASLAVARRLQQQFGDFIKVDVTEI